MTIYFDASFLVSLYSSDANTVAALGAIEVERGGFWTTTFGEFEFINMLALRVFRKHDTPQQSQHSLTLFQQDLRSHVFRIMPMPEDVFLRARQLSQETTQKMGTRASDVLHVAAALELGVEGFFTFDRQQARLAEMMKLKVNRLP